MLGVVVLVSTHLIGALGFWKLWTLKLPFEKPPPVPRLVADRMDITMNSDVIGLM